jgi:hypothetical protein
MIGVPRELRCGSIVGKVRSFCLVTFTLNVRKTA